ncbi:DNA-binding protein [Pantoea agglomerans]|uniref:DNA-binding protein n=1 Tax=Enterobacter agglomerans TaxID=549 RepID=UPI0010494588|nr:DNA-binding protein [Pantoea agglomerans]TCZ21591.1 hypothetical protein EYB39_23850 [Pantoea agglomerans]
MPINAEFKEKLQREFSDAERYGRKNALDLSQICCEMLAKHGLPLPGWQEIREIIGKGSATDVNKGKRLYQDQQGKLLSHLHEMPGVSEDMVNMMMQLRTIAFKAAEQSFHEKVSQWQEQLAEADQQRIESDERCEAAIRERDSWQRQAKDRQLLIDTLSDQLSDSKRSSNATIKRLEAALEESKQQIILANQRYEKTLQALQNMETMSDAAKAQLERDLNSIHKKLASLTTDHQLLEKQSADLLQEVKDKTSLIDSADLRIKELESIQNELIASGLAKDKRLEEKDERYENTLELLHESRKACSELDGALAAERHASRSAFDKNQSITDQLKKAEAQIGKLLTAVGKNKA